MDLAPRLLYRDGLMLILDKPAGMPVHAGPGGGDNLERHFDSLRFGLPRLPALAHRLDRDTSGCLILGRHPKALRRLGRLFSAGQIAKTYWAITLGRPTTDTGTIDLPLIKRNDPTGWRMMTTTDATAGQSAITDYQVLGSSAGLCWVQLFPRTGRTHQIRVHLAALGCPILGDPIYGNGQNRPAGQSLHLHARAIAVPLYPAREAITAIAPIPPHLQPALSTCGWTGETGT